MIESVIGFSAGSSLVGQLANGVILFAVALCALKCCGWTGRSRWEDD